MNVTSPQASHPLAEDRALRRRLLALARRWLADGSEAEDLVQDTYLRTATGDLPPTAAGHEAWLVTVLRHLCIDVLRRRERYRGGGGASWLARPRPAAPASTRRIPSNWSSRPGAWKPPCSISRMRCPPWTAPWCCCTRYSASITRNWGH